MTDEQIEKALKLAISCTQEQLLDYINRLKANLKSAIQSFTKMETLYKVKCKELEVVEEWKRRQQICNDTNTERIMQLTDENANLTVKLEATETDKANLERTIEELNDALSENGISVDGDGNIKNGSAEQIRKETAKEIYNDFKGFIRKDEVSLLLWLQAVIERYGVEL